MQYYKSLKVHKFLGKRTSVQPAAEDAIADMPGVVDQVKGLYNMYKFLGLGVQSIVAPWWSREWMGTGEWDDCSYPLVN